MRWLGVLIPIFLVFLAFIPPVMAMGSPDEAALTVTVDNVSPKGGILRLGIYTKGTYGSDTAAPVASFDLPAHDPAQVYEFHDLPAGFYAIEVFQDVNDDGKMDFNWLGFPTKPFGFSKDAVPFLGRPSFDRVEIMLKPGRNAQTIHLQNFLDGSVL